MEYAINLAMVAIGFLAMLPFMSLLFIGIGFSTNYNANYISIQKEDINLTLEYYTTMDYISYWDFEIPSISVKIFLWHRE